MTASYQPPAHGAPRLDCCGGLLLLGGPGQCEDDQPPTIIAVRLSPPGERLMEKGDASTTVTSGVARGEGDDLDTWPDFAAVE